MILSNLSNSIRAAEAAAEDMQTFATIYELAIFQTTSMSDVGRRPDAELICQLCLHLAKRTSEATSHVFAQFEALERSLKQGGIT